MRSLRFLSAAALVSDAPAAGRCLPGVAHGLYPLLFKASFLLERPELVRLLLAHWPWDEFLLAALLAPSADQPQDLRDRACPACLRACVQGLADHALRAGGRRLRVADLTGLRDAREPRCPCGRALGRWGRTELLATTCCGLQAAPAPAPAGRPLEVLAELFVTEGNLQAVLRALEGGGPLRLRCPSLRVDSLGPGPLLRVLRLAGPGRLRRLAVVHNVRLHAGHVRQLLAHGLPQLVSLALPTRALDPPPACGPDGEDRLLAAIGGQLGRMTQLTELSVAFSVLTGKLQRLLGPLRTPLRVLDLANCSLGPTDLAFLADCVHAAHLQELDLSGQPVGSLDPAALSRLLGRAAATLRTLALEECGLEDSHAGLLAAALGPCGRLRELRLLGNPLSARALRRLFAALSRLPGLRRVEFPVPSDCYPAGAAYPQDERAQAAFDRPRYEALAAELRADLARAGRADIEACTPLSGRFDPDIQETRGELGAGLLQAFRAALEGLSRALRQAE